MNDYDTQSIVIGPPFTGAGMPPPPSPVVTYASIPNRSFRPMSTGPVTPAPPPATDDRMRTLERWGPVLVMFAILAAFLAYVHFVLLPKIGPPAEPVVNLVAEGRGWSFDKLDNWAAGATQAKEKIKHGESLASVLADLKKSVSDSDRAAWTKRFDAVLRAIIPEGDEPADQAQRDKIARFYEGVIEGVNSAKAEIEK